MRPAVLLVVCCMALTASRAAPPQDTTAADDAAQDGLPTAPAKVSINPVARDEEIRQRLQGVLEATGWFTEPQVQVEEGIVFLSGQAGSDELKKWAGDLARNTQEVVAVANRIEVRDPEMWDFRPAWGGLLILWRDIIRSLPFVLFGLLILGLSIVAGILASRAAREVVFPQGIPVTLLEKKPTEPGAAAQQQPPQEKEFDTVTTKAEAGLYSDAVVIEEQARQAQTLKNEENLLPTASPAAAAEKQTTKPQSENQRP